MVTAPLDLTGLGDKKLIAMKHGKKVSYAK
jgi:hypothetical protein